MRGIEDRTEYCTSTWQRRNNNQGEKAVAPPFNSQKNFVRPEENLSKFM